MHASKHTYVQFTATVNEKKLYDTDQNVLAFHSNLWTTTENLYPLTKLRVDMPMADASKHS